MEKECIFCTNSRGKPGGIFVRDSWVGQRSTKKPSCERRCLEKAPHIHLWGADSGWQSSHERGPNVGTDRLASCWGAMGLTFDALGRSVTRLETKETE